MTTCRTSDVRIRRRAASVAAIATWLIAAALAGGASAAPATSRYTTFDSKSCPHKKGVEVEDYGSWICPGLGRSKVRLSAGDQRMFVTFGPAGGTTGKGSGEAGSDLAASQTFPAFNDVYDGTVEWRSDPATNGGRPFATILRWNVMTQADQETAKGPTKASGRVLVVTRLGPGGVCHVGYVDARANPTANALARTLADERAAAFRCGRDKRVVVGVIGPGLAMPADQE